MIRGEKLTRLLVSEESMQTAVREISSHQRHIKKEARAKESTSPGVDRRQSKDNDGYISMSCLFINSRRGTACALGRRLRSVGPSSAGRETSAQTPGSRKVHVPQGTSHTLGRFRRGGNKLQLGV